MSRHDLITSDRQILITIQPPAAAAAQLVLSSRYVGAGVFHVFIIEFFS